jgi:hypothetical protein
MWSHYVFDLHGLTFLRQIEMGLTILEIEDNLNNHFFLQTISRKDGRGKAFHVGLPTEDCSGGSLTAPTVHQSW